MKKLSFITMTILLANIANSQNDLKNKQSGSIIIDIDGNEYNTIIIGTQVWMKENLKVTKYRNGDDFETTIPANLDISRETTPKYQWAYNGDNNNVSTYGRLYTWFVVTDSRNVCPTGWHVPTDVEWTTLTDFLGGVSFAGGKMKEAGTTHWLTPNTGDDNNSGFTALPGGIRFMDGTFDLIGSYGYWWSVDEKGAPIRLGMQTVWTRRLLYNNVSINRNFIAKGVGISIRCLKD